MSDATWTPRTAREREAVVKIVRAALVRGWDARNSMPGMPSEDWRGFDSEALLAVPPVPAPPTRLREVVVGDGMKLRWNVSLGPRAEYFTFGEWREANHTQVVMYSAVLADLRDRPYEPAPDAVVEAIGDAFQVAWDACDAKPSHRTWRGFPAEAKSLAATVRALVRAEVEAQPLTVAEHVAALVEAGATVDKWYVRRLGPQGDTAKETRPTQVVLLPPEAP